MEVVFLYPVAAGVRSGHSTLAVVIKRKMFGIYFSSSSRHSAFIYYSPCLTFTMYKCINHDTVKWLSCAFTLRSQMIIHQTNDRGQYYYVIKCQPLGMWLYVYSSLHHVYVHVHFFLSAGFNIQKKGI